MVTEAEIAFLSYSRDDSDFALRLAEDLKAAGANVWMDQLDIEPGHRWDSAVEEALRSCPRVLTILSPSSLNSMNVLDELSFALNKKKTVIPVLYRECKVPFRLRPLEYVDFRTDYDHGLKTLLETLGAKQQTVAAGGAAVSAVPKESWTDVLDVDKYMHAAAEARREQERKREAEQARLDQERKEAVERERLEQERKQAAEQTQLEEQRKRAAEQARMEQETAKQARLEQERKQAAERPTLVFISYAHEDEELLKELKKHLSPLKRNRAIEAWYDHDIEAGGQWETEINDRLNSSEIILLLVSPDFLASDYCDSEAKRALERHETGAARVIPVILRGCLWSETSFSKLQALPPDGKPVTSFSDRDAAFSSVAEGILYSLRALRR